MKCVSRFAESLTEECRRTFLIYVTFVFSIDISKPRGVRNSTAAGSMCRSIIVLALAVVIKSSAYRTKLTRERRGTASLMACSRPSSVIFASIGLIIPPCGTPLRVGYENPSQYTQHLTIVSESVFRLECSPSAMILRYYRSIR